jgi:hypothetical protein
MREEVLGRRGSEAENPAGEKFPAARPGRGTRQAGTRLAAAMRTRMRWLAEVIRRHLLFSAVIALAVVPRIIVMLGFQPAILFKMDSYDYLWDAVHLIPNPVNPTGYSLLLWLLRPFHSLVLIAALQHVMGLVAAVFVYAALRYRGVRAWLSALAVLPLLFSPSQFLLEQLIMADLLSLALLVTGFAVLLLRRQPSLARCAVAGLLAGASAAVRPTTLPLIGVLVLYLLITRVGWRRAAAVAVGGALPLVAYMAWFYATAGSFNLTNSNGLFLWSRTMSFANCAIIEPPASLRPLCPEGQPLSAGQAAGGKRLAPKRYLWDHRAWQWQPPARGLVPDASAFTAANNDRALRFAVRAIAAQPGGYTHAVVRDLEKPFTKQIGFVFPPLLPHTTPMNGPNERYAVAAITAYLGSAQGLQPYLGPHFGERIAEPFGHLIRGYQRAIFLPGPVFALILLMGAVAMLVPRSRSAAGAMLWVSAMILLVLPVAEHEYNYRYALPAIPLACMAAALAFASRPPAAPPASADEATLTTVTADGDGRA